MVELISHVGVVDRVVGRWNHCSLPSGKIPTMQRLALATFIICCSLISVAIAQDAVPTEILQRTIFY
jgi:hypothetical protein